MNRSTIRFCKREGVTYLTAVYITQHESTVYVCMYIYDLTSSSQRDLQRLLDTKLSTTILEKASLRDRARLNTISAPHAGAWLRAIPNPNLSLAMPQREFIIAVRTWLGIPFFPPPPSSKRCFCGQVLDSYGDHLLGCGEGNWRNRRHNALADVVFEAL